MTDVNEVTQLYPQCTQPGVNLEKTFVAVHAAVKGNGLEYGSAVRLTFGMALWVAIVIHVIGVEIYVRITKPYLATFLTHLIHSNPCFLDPKDGIFESAPARIRAGEICR
jgi:hypothetical protein